MKKKKGNSGDDENDGLINNYNCTLKKHIYYWRHHFYYTVH